MAKQKFSTSTTTTTLSSKSTASSWILRVNAGLKLRGESEAVIAAALRERLDQVGEAAWLQDCEREWGWSRTTCYRHLNPELLQKDRDRAKARAFRFADRSEIGTLEPAPEDPAQTAVAEWAKDAETTLADPNATLQDVLEVERQAEGLQDALKNRIERDRAALKPPKQSLSSGEGGRTDIEFVEPQVRKWIRQTEILAGKLRSQCDRGPVIPVELQREMKDALITMRHMMLMNETESPAPCTYKEGVAWASDLRKVAEAEFAAEGQL